MAHQNIGFHRLQQHFTKHDFQALEKKHFSAKSTRKLSNWELYCFWLYVAIVQPKSLRDGVRSFEAYADKKYHLGLGKRIALSTLSEANSKRTPEIFREIFYNLLATLKSKHQRQFAFPLLALDSTLLTSNRLKDKFSEYNSTMNAVKVHLMIDAINSLPLTATITNGKTSDISVARKMEFEPGSMLLVDRGYFCTKWLKNLDNKGIFFIQRYRAGTIFTTLKQDYFEKTFEHGSVRSESTIQFMGDASQKYDDHLRMIEIYDDAKKETFMVITNNFELPVETIAAFYKLRWQIELIFKWLKQNMKMSRILGYSENAIASQIWTTLIAYLIVWQMRLLAKIQMPSLMEFLSNLRSRLFLPELRHRPEKPPNLQKYPQMTLRFAG